VSYGYYKPDPGSPGSETFVGPIQIVPPLLTEGFTLTGDVLRPVLYTLSDIKIILTTGFDAGYFIDKS